MSLKYVDARADIMRSIQVVKELVTQPIDLNDRRRHMDTFDALHRELAAFDSSHLRLSNDKYQALTLRFSGSVNNLLFAHAEAVKLAANLNTSASAITALSNLANALS